jgi:hypothetical protein
VTLSTLLSSRGDMFSGLYEDTLLPFPIQRSIRGSLNRRRMCARDHFQVTTYQILRHSIFHFRLDDRQHTADQMV